MFAKRNWFYLWFLTEGRHTPYLASRENIQGGLEMYYCKPITYFINIIYLFIFLTYQTYYLKIILSLSNYLSFYLQIIYLIIYLSIYLSFYTRNWFYFCNQSFNFFINSWKWSIRRFSNFSNNLIVLFR